MFRPFTHYFRNVLFVSIAIHETNKGVCYVNANWYRRNRFRLWMFAFRYFHNTLWGTDSPECGDAVLLCSGAGDLLRAGR